MGVYPPIVFTLTIPLLLSFVFGVRFSFKMGDQLAILGDAEDAVMHNAMNGYRCCAALEVLAGLGAEV